MSEALSSGHGSHPYFDVGAFKDAESQLDAIKTFVDVYRKSSDGRAKHYHSTYSTSFPPIWTMKEFLTFGTASRVFKNLAGPLRTTISKDFGISKDAVFSNWVECLVDLRNICAHHDRLFNRIFQKQPMKLFSAGTPMASVNRLKAILECLDYMLDSRGTSVAVTPKVADIIQRYPEIQPMEAGF